MHLAKLFSTSTMGLTQTSTLNLTMADLAVPAVVEVGGDAEGGGGCNGGSGGSGGCGGGNAITPLEKQS